MKKYTKKLFIIFFAVFFILPTLLYPFSSVGKENFENRNMAEKPTLTTETIQTFPSDYENYYNDNLPFRSLLIRTNAFINYKVFRQSPEKKVIIGKQNWLFYNPPLEDSDPIGQCTGSTVSEETLIKAAENLENMRDILQSQGRDFAAILCPNKESIYGEDFLPDYYNASTSSSGDQFAAFIQKNTDIKFSYPKSTILNAIKEYPEYDFYYKLDTHWNYLGGYIAAKDLFSCLQIELPEFDNINITSTSGRIGDLSNMTGVPEFFGSDTSYAVTGYTQDLPYAHESLPNVTTYLNENGNGKSVLVIRDSFSEGMYPYYNTIFSETNYINITQFYSECIQKCNPDIVVLQIVERYLDRFASFKIQ